MHTLSRLLVAAVCYLGFLPAYAADYPDVPVEMKPIRVSEHCYYVQGISGVATDNYGFVSNAAFVVTPEGVVVFDSLGTPPLGAKLLAAIRSVSSAPIKRLYISHYHADHMYGTQAFVETGAEIIAPTGAQRYLENEVAEQRLNERRRSLAPWIDENTRIVLPDRFLDGEERIQLGDVSLRAVNLGSAHSDGDMVLYVETDAVLFSGDIIFADRIPFLGSANSARWLEILQQMEKTEVRAIVPGHGAAANNPRQIVSLTLEYLSFMRAAMRQAVIDWIPFDEAYEATDWGDFFEYPTFLEANRQNAYGVYLSLEQELMQEQ